MRRGLKFMVLFFIICFAMGTIHVSAADERVGTVVDGSLLTDEDHAEGVIYPLARGSFLCRGTGGLQIVAGRTFSVSGSTACYQTVDSLNVTLYVQHLSGSTWVTDYVIPTKTAYNTYYVSTSTRKSVSGGHYYRVAGTHVAKLDGKTESIYSYSNGIWVY